MKKNFKIKTTNKRKVLFITFVAIFTLVCSCISSFASSPFNFDVYQINPNATLDGLDSGVRSAVNDVIVYCEYSSNGVYHGMNEWTLQQINFNGSSIAIFTSQSIILLSPIEGGGFSYDFTGSGVSGSIHSLYFSTNILTNDENFNTWFIDNTSLIEHVNENVLVEESFISLLVGGISELASGIGTGVNGFVQDLFFKVGTDGAVTGLSTFGGVVAIFGGVSLAVGLTTLLFRWIRSIGN